MCFFFLSAKHAGVMLFSFSWRVFQETLGHQDKTGQKAWRWDVHNVVYLVVSCYWPVKKNKTNDWEWDFWRLYWQRSHLYCLYWGFSKTLSSMKLMLDAFPWQSSAGSPSLCSPSSVEILWDLSFIFFIKPSFFLLVCRESQEQEDSQGPEDSLGLTWVLITRKAPDQVTELIIFQTPAYCWIFRTPVSLVQLCMPTGRD